MNKRSVGERRQAPNKGTGMENEVGTALDCAMYIDVPNTWFSTPNCQLYAPKLPSSEGDSDPCHLWLWDHGTTGSVGSTGALRGTSQTGAASSAYARRGPWWPWWPWSRQRTTRRPPRCPAAQTRGNCKKQTSESSVGSECSVVAVGSYFYDSKVMRCSE